MLIGICGGELAIGITALLFTRLTASSSRALCREVLGGRLSNRTAWIHTSGHIPPSQHTGCRDVSQRPQIDNDPRLPTASPDLLQRRGATHLRHQQMDRTLRHNLHLESTDIRRPIQSPLLPPHLCRRTDQYSLDALPVSMCHAR